MKKPEKKSERLSWAECMPVLASAEKRFHPVAICRAVIPCDDHAAAYLGETCGFPVESGDKFSFRLQTGEWAE